MELILFALIVKKQISRCLLSASYSWSAAVSVEQHPIGHCPTLKGATVQWSVQGGYSKQYLIAKWEIFGGR